MMQQNQNSNFNLNILNILNISTYKFVNLDQTRLDFFKQNIQENCEKLSLKGTAILAQEGLNLFLAGSPENIHAFFEWINSTTEFSNLQPKESFSSGVPFRRLIVKIKSEIITMRQTYIKPAAEPAPYVQAKTLKKWLDQGFDDTGREVVMMDTRNRFEVEIGSFTQAVDFNISKFTEFVPAIEAAKNDFSDKTVVSFCTGGIRCEKAAILMKDIGLEHVYQLDGGILKYFEEVGGEHYQGECFVFDYRTALKPDLTQSTQVQCYGCRAVLTAADQAHELYIAGEQCPHCASTRQAINQQKQAKIDAHNARKMSERRAYCQAQKLKFSEQN